MAGTKSPLWHPMTQHKIFPDSIHVDRAQGCYLYAKDDQGDERKILDGISSWWLNTHGHCHPKIVKAVQDEAARMDQVIFAGFTHDSAEAFAEKLLQMVHHSLGDELQHIFLSDSGSTAIEIALKMALGYFKNIGKPRYKIVTLDGGYHGDTFGAMSTGERGVFNDSCAPLLFDVETIPFPQDEDGANTLAEFENILQQNKNEIAALILEPLVQGAAGMRIYSPAVLKGLHTLCREHGVLLIADEVMTGFGRTGSMFACEQAGISSDLLCLSKGITGGFLPMGATLATAEIYDAFYNEDRSKMFFHSTSFTGNPLACAAALAALSLWDEEPVMERIKTIEKCHESAAKNIFRPHGAVSDVRVKGTVFALDIVDPNPGYLSTLGPSLYKYFLKHDILLRPIGNTVYILPPYIITETELGAIYDRILAFINTIARGDQIEHMSLGGVANESDQCAA
jgi:adenosylmethionine-8-amino-7-oxononanoate aminotransferase